MILSKLSVTRSAVLRILPLIVLMIAVRSSHAVTIYPAGTEEAKRLRKLITDFSVSPEQLEKALYPGIDLDRVIRYGDRVKKGTVSPNGREYQDCLTPLGVASFELGRYADERRDSILYEKVLILLRHGASPATDPPMLFRAIIDNRLDVATLILEKGVDVNALRARVCLQLKFQHQGHVIGLVYPLERMACNENEYRSDQFTLDTSGYMYPIHTAAAAGSHEMFDLLLSYGADCSLRDNFGQSVLEWALARGDRDQYFVKRIEEKLQLRGKKGGNDTVRLIILSLFLIIVIFFVKALLFPSRRSGAFADRTGEPRTGLSQRQPTGHPARSPAGMNHTADLPPTDGGLVFSSSRRPVSTTTGFSLKNRSHFTFAVSLVPLVFLAIHLIIAGVIESPLTDPVPIIVLRGLFFTAVFSWVWSFLVSLRFLIDDLRTAKGSYTIVGYIGVFITLALLVIAALSYQNGILHLVGGFDYPCGRALAAAVPLSGKIIRKQKPRDSYATTPSGGSSETGDPRCSGN